MRWRLLFADLLARVTFSVSTGMVIEIGIAGMTLMQSIYARLSMLPVVMLMARPYGIFRDWVLRKANVKVDKKGRPAKGSRLRYFIVNPIAYAFFFCPQYGFILWIEGATWPQVWKAVGSIAIGSPLLGALFGLWMDFVRVRIFRIPPQLDQQSSEKSS